MGVRFDRLKLLVRANELGYTDEFCMGIVCESDACGTVGCLVGNYSVMLGRDVQTFGGDYDEDWKHFGISKREYFWLFAESAFSYLYQHEVSKEAARATGRWLETDWIQLKDGLSDVEQKEAIDRVKKFLAYKLRKHQLLHDKKYGVSEQARRAEGNYNFVMLAKQDVVAI